MTEKEILYTLYVTENKRVGEILEELNISKTSFWRKIKKYNIRKDKKYFNEDNLESLYLDKNLSAGEIGIIFNVSKTTILRQLRKFKIIKSEIKVNESRNKTNIERYGQGNIFETKYFKEKRKNTLMEKYGVSEPFQDEEIKEKFRRTMEEKYGCISPLQNKDLKEKRNRTMMRRHGVIHPLQSQSILEQSLITRRKKYTVDLFAFPISNKRDIRTVNGETLKKFAEANNIGYTTLTQFIRNSDYKISEDELNDFIFRIKNNETNIEQIMSNGLKIIKFNKKAKKELSYRPDFKLSENIFLNADGLYWHSELHLHKRYHFDMREKFSNSGLFIFQFREDEIKEDIKFEIIKSMVANKLGNIVERVGARKCEVIVPSSEEKRAFYNENHIMGYRNGRAYALKYKDKIITMISFSIMKQKKTIKIERFCGRLNTVVSGGFSKLLSKIIKDKPGYKIEYWVDLRYGTGDFLKGLGFTHNRDTLGWKWTNFQNTFNRLQCRANMDKRRLTQAQHAEELGWVKIYDAGQRLYTK